MLEKYGIKSFIVIVTLVAALILPVKAPGDVDVAEESASKAASAKVILLVATIEKRIDQLQAKGNKSNWEEDLLRQARDIQGFICPSSYSCR